jgi:hypothetical protein
MINTTKGITKRENSRILEFKTYRQSWGNGRFFNKLTQLNKMNEAIKLTSFSHGAGCGCKLSPKS